MRWGAIGSALVCLGTTAAVIAAAGALVGSGPARRPPAEVAGTVGAERARSGTAAATNRDQARKLTALDAIMDATVGAVEAPSDYWRDDRDARRRYGEALIEANSRARAALIAEFGADARDDPAFGHLFRPLDHRLAVLTSEHQIAVHEAELRLSLSAPNAFDDHLIRLGEEIGEAAAFEYAVRSSPLSQQIRSSGVGFTESEFRETYTLLAGLSHRGPGQRGLTQNDYHDIRRMLRDLLGGERFTVLWAARDPRYRALARLGERYRLSTDAVMSAYRLLNDAQDALLAEALTESGDRRADAGRLRAIYDTARNRLADIVGKEPADAIIATLSLLPKD